ncbi:MAG TPA: DUF4342 domain-containing protein [Anaerovoracaceae bacterium]|nr:DUF4342 domain-containing protein [Anaerovoracaceae bacterium]
MVTLEQVEKLREYANVSYDEAKAALENAGGDILQALIDLERQGKVKPPQGGGQYNSGSIEVSGNTQKDEFKKEKDQSKCHSGEKSAFSRNMGRFFRWMGEVIHKGNVNALVVEKNGSSIMRLPITVLALLLFFAFYIVVPLLIIGLFFSFRYYIQGPDIKSTKVNDAMDTVANAAEEIKNDMKK